MSSSSNTNHNKKKSLSLDETISLHLAAADDHDDTRPPQQQQKSSSSTATTASGAPKRAFTPKIPLSSSAISTKFKLELKQKEGALFAASSSSGEQFEANIGGNVMSNRGVESLEGRINPTIIKNLKEFMKIDKLTRIQSKSLFPFLSKNNILVKSETGSGKTLSYVIPLIQLLFDHSLERPSKIQRSDGTFALILAPTRELCIQIERVVKQVSVSFPWIVSGTVMGGEKKKAEKERLRKGVTVLIATPGRLEDHLKTTSAFKYDELRHVILDEADRLLDLGFERTIHTIFDIMTQKLKQPVQRVLISATLHAKIQKLATGIGLTNAVYIREDDESDDDESGGGARGDKKDGDGDVDMDRIEDRLINLEETKLPSDVFTIPSGLSQYYVLAPCKIRLALLSSFLQGKTQQGKKSKIVVFVSCCDSVEYHYSLFTNVLLKRLQTDSGEDVEDGREAVNQLGKLKLVQKLMFDAPLFKLHGDMTQKDRTTTYFQFCKAETGILFCTDVAARGLDLPAVDWIVQFDAPGSPKEYLHRIGRTARLGDRGSAVMFLMPHELLYLKLLEKYNIKMKEITGRVIFQSILKTIGKREVNNEVEAGAYLQNLFANVTTEKEFLYKKAIAAYQSFIRYYATHTKDVKIIFHVNNLHLGHVASSFGLKDKPSKLRAKQTSLGATSVAVKKQQREKEFEKRDRNQQDRDDAMEEQAELYNIRTRKPRKSSNIARDDRDDFGVPSSEDTFEVVKPDQPAPRKEPTPPMALPADLMLSDDDNDDNDDEPKETKRKTKYSLSSSAAPLSGPSIPPPPIKKKKLSTAERLQRFKDFSKGKLSRDRPSIVIPEGMFKNNKKKQQAEQPKITVESTEDMGKGRQRKHQNAMLRNPFNKRERVMIGGGMTSEFDSGFSSATKARRLQ